jgi:hypothetical protein
MRGIQRFDDDAAEHASGADGGGRERPASVGTLGRRHCSLFSFALYMRLRVPMLSFLPVILLSVSCRTDLPSEETVAEWPGSQVFKGPQEVEGYQRETLELKEGRFRYWSATDVIELNPPKYPLEGNYDVKGDQLVLSNGDTYTVRTIHGRRTVWHAGAIDEWDRHQSIDRYGILLPVRSLKSRRPALKPFFTKEEWHHSDEQYQAP